jgi:hypothetical protein
VSGPGGGSGGPEFSLLQQLRSRKTKPRGRRIRREAFILLKAFRFVVFNYSIIYQFIYEVVSLVFNHKGTLRFSRRYTKYYN